MERNETLLSRVHAEISKAFQDVRLGDGVSIKQSKAIDQNRKDITRAEYDALSRSEITDKWSDVPDSELEELYVAYLDAEGFRYYIPALALSVARQYESGSMRVIGTLLSLYPKKEHWDFDVQRYSLLDLPQRKALATFLKHLPELVELRGEDTKIVDRAFRNYWQQFLDE